VADWDGQSYREVSALQTWVATRSLAGVAMAGDERVLDVGCGDGRITAAVAEQLPDGSILGIDPSPRMIAAAGTFSSPRLRFAVGDVLSMASGTSSTWWSRSTRCTGCRTSMRR
jgi:trans-aconitate 2-methyltransferase